jgi:hypothetical protein
VNTLHFSPLESAVLDRFHSLYQVAGFPNTRFIRALRRENTGGGRYVEIESDYLLKLDNGYVDLAGHFIEMSGLPSGTMAVVLVNDGRVKLLELTTYGGDFWDGEERVWKIV